MTVTITAGNATATDFYAYLDAFDTNFVASGRGAFSLGLSGDYAAGEAGVTETADLGAQGFIMGDNIEYSLSTHILTGTVSNLHFGYGLTGVENTDVLDLDLAQLDFSIEFSEEITDEETVNDVIYGMLGYVDEGEGETDAIEALIAQEDIIFEGNDGNDYFVSGDNRDELNGYAGNDNLNGGRGKDTVDGGEGNDTVKGGGGKDEIDGGIGSDTIKGGNGGDTLLGDKGYDKIDGGKGNDVIDGGRGNDEITGGRGNDTMTGDRGDDTFVFEGNFGTDTITDFEPGDDVIDFSDLSGEASDFQAFIDASTETATGVTYDLGGDGQNVLILEGLELSDLSASDFLF